MSLTRSSLCYAASASIPIIISLLSTPASIAQVTVTSPTPNTQFPTISTFKPSLNTSCPVSTFSVTGFAGRGDGNASARNANPPLAFSDANAENYGVAAGFTIPIGGGTTLCKALTKQLVEYEAARTQTAILLSQITLLKQCEALVKSGFDKMSFEKDEDNNFSVLKVCSSVSFDDKDPLQVEPFNIPEPSQDPGSVFQIQESP